MKHFISYFLSTVLTVPLFAQNEGWGYEYEGELPVYIDSIQVRLTYPLAYRNYMKLLQVGDVEIESEQATALQQTAWKVAAKMKLAECMGERPPLADNWDMQVLAEEQRNGYKAVRMSFALSRWYRVKAYLLIPDSQKQQNIRFRRQSYKVRAHEEYLPSKFPAVVVLHDHGAHLTIGKEKVVRPFAVDTTVVKDADTWVAQLYDGQYLGDYLARNGYVVLAIDMPLWGERGRKEGADRKKYDIIAGNMMMGGANLCAFTHYDDVASVEFLSSLPFVDAERIGVAGLSIGAYRAWMLAALSDKVKVTCADCWMITAEAQLTRRYGRRENGGFANAIPGLRNWLDYPDIASISAPHPMLFINGTKDKLFPIDGVKRAFDIMHGVWDAFGASGNLETHLLEQGHECNKTNQQMMLDFFDKHLK